MDIEKEEFSKKERALIRMAANQLVDNKYDTGRAWRKVSQKIDRRRSGKRWFLNYIAVGMLLVTGGVTMWLYPVEKQMPVSENKEILQASGSAELILATGERVLLDTLTTYKRLEQPGTVVIFDTVSRRLQYKNNLIEDTAALFYNRLNVPKGGEYSLVLADGTRVWLNSESSLRFPVKFGKNKREVFLEGEAYFEVAVDKNSPFCVRLGERSVQVLGTSFNISAYHSDDDWHATLIEGKVKVMSGGNTVFLEPSEQYIESIVTGRKEVRKVDVNLYTSWRDGLIPFKGERFEDIVRKLERWYDFHMFYANEEIKDMRFRGVISRYDSFDVVLRHLEQTTDINFEINKNTVIAKKIYSK